MVEVIKGLAFIYANILSPLINVNQIAVSNKFHLFFQVKRIDMSFIMYFSQKCQRTS